MEKTQDVYKYYQSLLGDIPEFLKKYLELDILIRLKDISLLCGMDYASKDMYKFARYVSRYDHSLNAALITWKLTHDKRTTLAALFHDVSSPAFSHVVDFMNGDKEKQESTEEKTGEILLNSKELNECLESDDIDVESIINFKDYSIVDLSRPHLCADRIESTISLGLSWINVLDYNSVKKIIDNLDVYINEDNVQEIGFKDSSVADYIMHINNEFDRLTHSKNDSYMMNLMADILRKCISINLFSYDDLFNMGEHDVIDIIEENKSVDIELDNLWLEFKTTKKSLPTSSDNVKKKSLNPLINGFRLFEPIKN